MRSSLWLCSLPLLVIAGVLIAFWACDRVIHSLSSRHGDDDESESAKTRRRGVTGAAFALQQVFDPGIEHVIKAQRDAEEDEADPAGGDDDEPAPIESYFDEVVEALIRSPIDTEEIRRLLTDADRDGHDWRELYAKAVENVEAERPFLAPKLPPVSRVSPR